MLEALEEGRLADRLWDLWGRTEQNAARTKVIKMAAKELEAVLVEQAVNEDEQHRGRDDEVDLPPSKTSGEPNGPRSLITSKPQTLITARRCCRLTLRHSREDRRCVLGDPGSLDGPGRVRF
jgi:hypothetical protein